MNLLNATDHCHCSRPKRKANNFCDDCWEAIPCTLNERYMAAVLELKSITECCHETISVCPITGYTTTQ
jgi:hypothetical protein